MREWSAEQVAAERAFHRAVIDSRAAGPGDLFFGLVGENVDGGRYAQQALDNGAWGVVVKPEHADGLSGGVVLAAAPKKVISITRVM